MIRVPPFIETPARAAASPFTTTVPPRIEAATLLPALPCTTTVPFIIDSAVPERAPPRYLFRGDCHEILGLGKHQRLEAVMVADVCQRVGTGGQVTERAVKVIERRAQGVSQ